MVPIFPGSIGPCTVSIRAETPGFAAVRANAASEDADSKGLAAPAARAERKSRRSMDDDYAFFSTSFSKSQDTGALRLTDSLTMWATAAAWCPRRPSS